MVLFFRGHAQELYPLNEPASTVPKNVVGLRVISQNYREVNINRSLEMFRIMYGLTAKLSVMATASISNHHSRTLPADFISHEHIGNQTNYFTNTIQRGKKYPFLFNGVYLFAKYRFLTLDNQNQHLRLAAYADWSNSRTAHDEAEPTLMDDNAGYGGGLIATWLKNRFAASVTWGIIKPKNYTEALPDISGGPDLPTRIIYGDAQKLNLSLGYRLYPQHYTSYDQPNWNIYLEFMGKQYNAARVIQNGSEIPPKTPALIAGSYVEINPGIQYIVKSNFRVELSVGLALAGRAYTNFPPVWTLAAQQYIYRKKKS
jgi:hypothetical protein